MTTPGSGQHQWEQPDFNVAIFPLWKRPIVWIGGAAVLAVGVALAMNSNQSGQTSDLPSPAVSNTYIPPSAVPTETVTFTPGPSPTAIVSSSPTSSPSETQPSDDPVNDDRTIIFNSKGKNGGELSAPAITWGEGYRNIIRFTCNNSNVTAGLTVKDPEGTDVKTIDPKKLKWMYPRPCVGDKVSKNVADHPSEYYLPMLGLIAVKQ